MRLWKPLRTGQQFGAETRTGTGTERGSPQGLSGRDAALLSGRSFLRGPSLPAARVAGGGVPAARPARPGGALSPTAPRRSPAALAAAALAGPAAEPPNFPLSAARPGAGREESLARPRLLIGPCRPQAPRLALKPRPLRARGRLLSARIRGSLQFQGSAPRVRSAPTGAVANLQTPGEAMAVGMGGNAPN